MMCLVLILASCDNNEDIQMDEKSLSQNDAEINPCAFDFHNQVQSSAKPTAAILTDARWVTGQTIRIKFLNGSSFLQEKFKKYASEWIMYANLKLEYVSIDQYAEIRVSFDWKGDHTSWSNFGSYSSPYYKNQNEPSINFGNFTDKTSEAHFSRVILHEFGHALGLVHEHQSPASGINWNKPVIYEHYRQQSNLSESDVDYSLFMKYRSDETNYTNFDPLSIMIYSIHYTWTTDGFSVRENRELSQTDKQFISTMYPYKSILFAEERLTESPAFIHSPNGQFSLLIRSEKLVIYDNDARRDLWHLSPNIKFNNFTSTKVYCILRDGELLLFKGSVPRTATGEKSLGQVDYATLTNSGDIELFKNNIAVWSLFKGKLN
jgi:hypothetical protein